MLVLVWFFLANDTNLFQALIIWVLLKKVDTGYSDPRKIKGRFKILAKKVAPILHLYCMMYTYCELFKGFYQICPCLLSLNILTLCYWSKNVFNIWEMSELDTLSKSYRFFLCPRKFGRSGQGNQIWQNFPSICYPEFLFWNFYSSNLMSCKQVLPKWKKCKF